MEIALALGLLAAGWCSTASQPVHILGAMAQAPQEKAMFTLTAESPKPSGNKFTVVLHWTCEPVLLCDQVLKIGISSQEKNSKGKPLYAEQVKPAWQLSESGGQIGQTDAIPITKNMTFVLTATAKDGRTLDHPSPVPVLYPRAPAGQDQLPPNPTIVGFTSNPPSLTGSGKVTLSWTTHNATHVTLTRTIGAGEPHRVDVSEKKANDHVDQQVEATTTFTLTALNESGATSAPKDTAVGVADISTNASGNVMKITSFKANGADNPTVIAGTSVEISWETKNAAKVVLVDGNAPPHVYNLSPPGGGSFSTPVSSTTTFKLTATNATGDESIFRTQTVTVKNTPSPYAFELRGTFFLLVLTLCTLGWAIWKISVQKNAGNEIRTSNANLVSQIEEAKKNTKTLLNANESLRDEVNRLKTTNLAQRELLERNRHNDFDDERDIKGLSFPLVPIVRAEEQVPPPQQFEAIPPQVAPSPPPPLQPAFTGELVRDYNLARSMEPSEGETKFRERYPNSKRLNCSNYDEVKAQSGLDARFAPSARGSFLLVEPDQVVPYFQWDFKRDQSLLEIIFQYPDEPRGELVLMKPARVRPGADGWVCAEQDHGRCSEPRARGGV